MPYFVNGAEIKRGSGKACVTLDVGESQAALKEIETRLYNPQTRHLAGFCGNIHPHLSGTSRYAEKSAKTGIKVCSGINELKTIIAGLLLQLASLRRRRMTCW